MERSRAVLLPTPGDPFLVSAWLRRFEVWRPHVDALYVVISYPQEAAVLDRLCADVVAAGGTPLIAPLGMYQHGDALTFGLQHVHERHTFMAEDDLYVRDPRLVEEAFAQVEAAGVFVGVSRASMSAELHDVFKHRHVSGAGLWPFVFARTEDLRAITETFGARIWAVGEHVLGMDYICVEECNADTFGAASMEVRGRWPVVEAEYPAEAGRWYHVGSLSSGPFVADKTLDHVRAWAWSWRTRVQWWQRFYDEWPGGLDEQHAAYGAAVARLRAIL